MDNLQTAARDLTMKLIGAELDKQDSMWGTVNERVDVSHGELLDAARSQLWALVAKLNGDTKAFNKPPATYPKTWNGFRDYGSDVANLVVAVAFLTNEIKRKIANGESTERLARTPAQTPPGYPTTEPTPGVVSADAIEKHNEAAFAHKGPTPYHTAENPHPTPGDPWMKVVPPVAPPIEIVEPTEREEDEKE